MKRWHILLIIGIVICGIAFAIWMSISGGRETRPAPPLAEPVARAYHNAISGSGVIEAGPNESDIGSNLAGIVTTIYVTVGEEVEVDQPLFKLDDRDAKSQVQLSRTELEVAKKRVGEAKYELADKTDQYKRVEKIADPRAVSIDEVNKRRFAMQIAEAKLDTAAAEEMRARARLKVAETNLDLLTVRSPMQGQVLQVNVDVGEYAFPGEQLEPIIVLGGRQYEVRVDIDENDAWRFSPKGKAVATLRGNPSITFPLEFISLEPFVIPKKALTRDTSERVDTRVLQVHYKFDQANLPIYIGQQVDVTIEALEVKM